MNFAPKHVVTMVVAISLAAVLTPVGVMAATGQLVNIVDPVLGDRKVRVGSSGALQVETRPGVTSTAANVAHEDVSFTGRRLLEVVSPTRAALSELTVAVTTVPGGAPDGRANVVELVRYLHTSGTAPCGTGGWGSGAVLRRVTLKTDTTIQLKFDGPPLIVAPGATGQRVCLAVRAAYRVGDTSIDIGATVFSYS